MAPQRTAHHAEQPTRHAQDTSPGKPNPLRTSSTNRVALMGWLTMKPQVRMTRGNLPMAALSLVTTDRQEPQFHTVLAWRALAEEAAHLSPGEHIYIEGHLKGTLDRRGTDIYADRVQRLGLESPLKP